MSATSVTLKKLFDVTGVYGTSIALDAGAAHWAVGNAKDVQLGAGGTAGRTVVASDRLGGLAWSSDGKRLFAAPHIYDVAHGAWAPRPWSDGALVSGLDEPPPLNHLGIRTAAWAPDGQELVISTYLQQPRGIDAPSLSGPRQRVIVIGADHEARGVLYAGDDEQGALAVSEHRIAAGGLPIQIWDRASLRKLASVTTAHSAYALAFDATGTQLAAITADGIAVIWDAATGKQLASFTAHQDAGHAIAFHPTKPILATGGQDGKLKLWTSTGTALATESLGGWVQAVAFDPTGTRLAAAALSDPPHLVVYSIDP